ncbi:MAG TPA: SRPBCC family protein [Vitreimonas sp.]|uniref:SRPBCC family protein n=1 Tax=Vitreimonas sp. TaxID=3069702 RepID=UPI002D69D327|nr:SRPBCC family protein [Vitreimonas sp.]HYD87641.1 SRPBCC family protein [Vitreimonas sp.]
MRRLLFALALFLAPPATAQDYRAPPTVSVQRESDGGGVARASMDIAAPPEAVFIVLSDCAHAQRYMPELISCRVLERGPGWELREHRVRGWLLRPVLRNVARVDLEPNHRLSFRRVEGDWTRSDGEWRLTPIDGGRGTHVTYTVAAAVRGGAPDWLTVSRLRALVRRTLVRLRHEAQRAG